METQTNSGERHFFNPLTGKNKVAEKNAPEVLPLQYKGYTIQEDYRNPYSNVPEYMIYPTEQGIDHDADCDGEGFRYCGNCKWFQSLEDAKAEIDDIVTSHLEVESYLIQVNVDGAGNKVKEYMVEVKGHKSHHVKVTVNARVAGVVFYLAHDIDIDVEIFGTSYISEVEAIRDLLKEIY